MTDVKDMDLVRDYGQNGSETAFAALVQRHINLVYSAALRHVGTAAHTEEITQAVFIILARKAASLRPDTILEGWLHETTRLTALSFLRGERRRQSREHEAYMQATIQDTSDTPPWTRLAPHLDEALSRLRPKDRDAVMLRFFKERDLREVASALQVTESAAQRRVHRAVEKLRHFFQKRGILLTAATLTAAISANSVQAAPVPLAKMVTTVAIAKGAMASGSTLLLIQGVAKLMAWAKVKTTVAISTGTLLVVGTTTVLFLELNSPRAALPPTGEGANAVPAATPLDLTANYTTPAFRFDQITQIPAWKTVPRGFQTFANVPFQIGGQFCLWGEGNATTLGLNFPEQITGIKVRQKFETLYVYHGAFFKSADGTPVCAVVFRYEDGSSATNQMLYDDDVLDWVAKGDPVIGPSGPNSTLAWVGGTFTTNSIHPLRFCLTAIDNPSPSLEVETLDFYSCKSYTAACIMALTTGKAGLMR